MSSPLYSHYFSPPTFLSTFSLSSLSPGTPLALLSTPPHIPQLLRPAQAFDPEVPELLPLLPESRFPVGVFRHANVLAALRPLGLKGTLDWSGLVESAASVEALRDGGDGQGNRASTAAAAGGGEASLEDGRRAARIRGRALLTYLDTHETQLFDLKQESSGFLQRISKLVYVDPAAEKRGRERLATLGQLMALSWVSPKALLYFGGYYKSCKI